MTNFEIIWAAVGALPIHKHKITEIQNNLIDMQLSLVQCSTNGDTDADRLLSWLSEETGAPWNRNLMG